MSIVIEERFAALEAEVARLRNRIEGRGNIVAEQTSHDFLDAMVGIHANSPAFEEVTRQLEEERERERKEARRIHAESEQPRA